jgi:hypothetical protein
MALSLHPAKWQPLSLLAQAPQFAGCNSADPTSLNSARIGYILAIHTFNGENYPRRGWRDGQESSGCRSANNAWNRLQTIIVQGTGTENVITSTRCRVSASVAICDLIGRAFPPGSVNRNVEHDRNVLESPASYFGTRHSLVFRRHFAFLIFRGKLCNAAAFVSSSTST